MRFSYMREQAYALRMLALKNVPFKGGRCSRLRRNLDPLGILAALRVLEFDFNLPADPEVGEFACNVTLALPGPVDPDPGPLGDRNALGPRPVRYADHLSYWIDCLDRTYVRLHAGNPRRPTNRDELLGRFLRRRRPNAGHQQSQSANEGLSHGTSPAVCDQPDRRPLPTSINCARAKRCFSIARRTRRRRWAPTCAARAARRCACLRKSTA